jgi:hypothetical protein
MAIRKIYTNQGLQLEVQWSSEGIHLSISEDDKSTPLEFILEPSDLYDFAEDIEIYTTAIEESNSKSKI